MKKHFTNDKLDTTNCQNSDLKIIYENINSNNKTSIENNCVFTAHEGLILNYEECFVRKCYNDKYYVLSSHILWIGKKLYIN